MRIAIASSGLGHVRRGIETWAVATAHALHRQGTDVTLFAAGPLENEDNPPGTAPRTEVVPSLRRSDPWARRLARLAPAWTWRWQLRNPYGWEQLSFWRHLQPHLRHGGFHLLHVQDPMLAYWCLWSRRLGRLSTREILAHGTEETPEFLGRFERVQHLAPWHQQQAEAALARKGRSGFRHWWVTLPNFVDTRRFSPPEDPREQAAARAALGMPSNAWVVGCVAALKRPHKRLDYLIEEFARWQAAQRSDRRPFLLLAGARTEDTPAVIADAETKGHGIIRVLIDHPRDRMLHVYRAMEVFVLPSLFEMMPIALLEAMACGIPVITHQHPVLEWISGANGPKETCGGWSIDMSRAGALAEALRRFFNVSPQDLREGSRRRAERWFSEDVVIAGYIDYYRRLLEPTRGPRRSFPRHA